jgi:lipoyl(octanoyl) transferase
LCEHPATITLGTGATADDLAFPAIYYERQGIPVLKSPRGGKATYHGPGQLVVYPLLHLRERGIPIHRYLRFMEALMILICAEYGVEAHRMDGKAGCWVGKKKIGFIGVRVRRGFCFHGISLNISPQHDPFRMIIPCGMPGLHLTSLEEETGQAVLFHDVSRQTQRLFFAQFSEII